VVQYMLKKNGNNAHFRIRDRKIITSIILPIFDKYPLLTSKWYNYNIFKQSCLILNNNTLSKIHKDNLINKLLPLYPKGGVRKKQTTTTTTKTKKDTFFYWYN